MVVTQGRWKEGFPMDDVRRAQVSYGGHTTCTQVSFGHDAGRLASVPQGWQHPGHPSTSERNLASFPRISFPHSLPPSFFNFIPIIISPRDPRPLTIIFIILVLSSMWSTPLNDRRRLAPRKWVASNAKSIHTPALSSCLKIHHHYLHWNHHNQHLLNCNNQIVVNKIRILAQRWTLSESHLLKMDFGVFQPSAVLSIRITLCDSIVEVMAKRQIDKMLSRGVTGSVIPLAIISWRVHQRFCMIGSLMIQLSHRMELRLESLKNNWSSPDIAVGLSQAFLRKKDGNWSTSDITSASIISF